MSSKVQSLINQMIGELESLRRLTLAGTVETDTNDNRSVRPISPSEAAGNLAELCEQFRTKAIALKK